MNILTTISVVVLAALHLYFMYMEMFAWDTLGKKAFGKSIGEEAWPKTKGLAANQGLYNGFLAAGLIWSLCIKDEIWSKNVGIFFSACVLVAGLYGAYSASRKIFFIQGLPALICLILLWLK
jgi:putative membrane protein